MKAMDIFGLIFKRLHDRRERTDLLLCGSGFRQWFIFAVALGAGDIRAPQAQTATTGADLTAKDIPSFLTACNSMKQFATSPHYVDGNLAFSGNTGGQQIDPQIAVGGNAVISVLNTGIVMYSKTGEFVSGGSTSCLNLDFDPKALFDGIGKRFVLASMSFAGSVRISFSKAADPKGGWWAYTIPAPGWVDGGAVGVSKKWVAYSYPANGGEKVIFFDRVKAEAGGPVTLMEFPVMPNPGQPAYTYDTAQDNLYFTHCDGRAIQLKYIAADASMKTLPAANTNFNLSYPSGFPQKGSSNTPAAGDIMPKLAVVRNGFVWAAHAATSKAGGATRTLVRFYQVDLAGKLIQSAAIDDSTGQIYSGQVSLAVNKNNDLLLVFQQSGKNMFISSRMSYRLAGDPLGTLRPVVKIAEGQGASTNVGAWGDYSGASVDGDNDVDLWGINSVASSSGAGNTSIFKLNLPASSLNPPKADNRFTKADHSFMVFGTPFRAPEDPRQALSITLYDMVGKKTAVKVGSGNAGEMDFGAAQAPHAVRIREEAAHPGP